MIINSINSAVPQKCFRGIWVKEAENEKRDIKYLSGVPFTSDKAGTIKTTKQYSYYPFIDEKEKAISELLKSKSCKKTFNILNIKYIEITNVELKKALPFTKSEFENFIKGINITNKEFIRLYFKLFDFFIKKIK